MSSDRFKVGDRVFFYVEEYRYGLPLPQVRATGTVVRVEESLYTIKLDRGHPVGIGWSWEDGISKAWNVSHRDIRRMKTDLGNSYE